MGVWTAQPDGSWAYDHNAPSLSPTPALALYTVSYPDPAPEVDPDQMPPEHQHAHGGHFGGSAG